MTDVLFKDKVESEKDAIGKIEGELPVWLNGTLIRSGPGKWDLDEKFSLNHFLDGSAMMIKFEIDPNNKSVRAKSRFLRSNAYEKCCSQKRPVFTEFGTQAFTDTSKGFFARTFNKLVPSDLTDNDISNIYKINDDEIYMTTESCNIWMVNPNTLDSLMKVNLDKKAGIAISCSHPIYCEEENVLYNVGSTFLTGMKYHIMKVPLDARSQDQKTSFDNSSIICSFPSSYKASLGYIAITKNYVIVIEQSLLVNGMKLATCTPKGKSLEECLEWCPNAPSRFHVYDKRTNKLVVHKFETKAFFFFHSINAYEADDEIVLDIINYDDHGLMETLRMNTLRAGKFETISKSKPTRYVLPMRGFEQMKKNENLVKLDNSQTTAFIKENGVIQLTGQLLGPAGLEMPTINSKYIGKDYNFIYGSGFLEKGFYENSMAKLDIKANNAILYKNSATSYPGEGVFVASPNSQDEDDGVILTLVLETDQTKNPFLAVLDAKTLQELAKIEFNRDELSVPTTIHGIWLPNKRTCFLAIFWCSFATFTKVMINLHSFALSKKRNLACDQAYLYIPAVFVVAFYLLYLIECFHSETRYSLKHTKTSLQVINEIEKLRESLPVIWWKALNYHYLRRTRLITRYRQGEAYSTTQVYFQRINSRITSTCYVYDLNDGSEFGNTVSDISKKIIDLDKFPLTRIRLSKGFAFSNVLAANDFERQRNLFFISSEQLDDFLEMREGMDLISSRFRDNILCVPTKKPWYVSQTAFWLFSLCLLSWPYRVFINMNTGILNYQIIKLFNTHSSESENDSTALLNTAERNTNFTGSDDLLGNHNCSLPPSYSQAMMLLPPTYNYIKQLLYEQENTSENQSDNANENYVLDRIDKFQQNNNNNIIEHHQNRTNHHHHNSLVEQSINTAKLSSTPTDHQTGSQMKARIPSSLSCSFLNGQLVYLVNTLKNTTTTLNSSIDDHLNCVGTSLDVKNTTPADCSSLLNANSRVQIIGAGSLHETENLSLNLNQLNNCAVMLDGHQASREMNINMVDKLSDFAMLNSCSKLIPRSFTSENISYLKRFSIRIMRRIKSMQNLGEQNKPPVDL